MKKSKVLYGLLLLAAMLSNYIRAQSPIFQYITDINAQLANIPYVFEGQVQSVEIFAGDKYGNRLPNTSVQWNGDAGYFYLPNGKMGYGYSLATIKVCKVYKGKIQLERDYTFKVLTRAHSLNNIFLDRSDASNIVLDYLYTPATHLGSHEEDVILPHNTYPTKLYLCDKLDAILGADYAHDTYYQSNFHALYDLPMYQQVEVMQPNGISTMQSAYCTLFGGNVFKDQNEFRLFLEAIGLNSDPTSFCDWKDQGGDHNESTAQEVQETKIDHSKNVKRYNEMVARYKTIDSLKALSPIANRAASNNNLAVDIRNERIVKVGAQPWFEFDIYISANTSGLYFDNCLTAIDYNTAVFGSNVAANNNIVVTAAAPYQISTYVNPQSVVNDNTTSEVNVSLGIDQSQATLNRITCPTTPQLLLTVRMKIPTCGLPVNITAGNTFFTPILCRYTTIANVNSTSPNIQPFDNVAYTGNITDMLVCLSSQTGQTIRQLALTAT